MLFLGVPTAPYAQDDPTGTEKSDRLMRQLAINLLRTINTAEVVDQATYGLYSSWPTLLANNQAYFDKLIAMHRQQLPNVRFADLPEIFPGWNLRMNVHADG
jgi:hypothetical protein